MNPRRRQYSESDASTDPAVETALQSLDRAVAAGSAERIAYTLELRRRGRRRFRLVLGAVASCLLVGFLVLVRTPAPQKRAPVEAEHSSTLVIAPASRVLPDGTMVDMKAGAQLDVEFVPALRRVVLRSGEAHFAVQKDSARPFVVVAGGVEVRAVGTAFSVDVGDRAVAVLVTEGRVSLATPAAGVEVTGAPQLVDAGTRAVVLRNEGPTPMEAHLAAVTAAETIDHLAWRVRRLEFSGTPLADAIPLFNEHSGARLALDPALGALRLSGTLRVDDLEALLFLLQTEFGITAETRGDGSVGLRRR